MRNEQPMFLERIFKPNRTRIAGERLYAAIVAQARAPALYEDLGAPDTPDGRFEVYTLHVLLVLERLRAAGADGKAVAQALFDAYLSGLDHGLRELAVGDLSVGKTMRRLGEAFYGRGKALDQAFAALPDRAPLESLIRRTVFGGVEPADPAPMAGYVLAARQSLAAAPAGDLTAGEIAWRTPDLTLRRLP